MTTISRPIGDAFVAGERLQALVAALIECKPERIENGSYKVDAELDTATGAPLARALMRVEAEMLLADAEAIRPDLAGGMRTPDQRRADAFLELAHRVHDAIRVQAQ